MSFNFWSPGIPIPAIHDLNTILGSALKNLMMTRTLFFKSHPNICSATPVSGIHEKEDTQRSVVILEEKLAKLLY